MGKVLGALSEKLALPASVELLETLATRRATLFVVKLGLHDSIFKGDSEVVMQALSRGVSLLSPTSHYGSIWIQLIFAETENTVAK